MVKKTITLLVRDLNRFEPMLNELLQAGVNELDSLSFRNGKFQALKAQARDEAVKNARDKADAMAADLGRRVGKPLKIVERRNPYYGDEDSETLSELSQLGYLHRSRAPASPAPQTYAGSTQISSQVTVVFELE